MTRTLALLWLGLVLGTLIWLAISKTNRHFWKGVGFGLLLTVCAVITGLAIGMLIPKPL